MGIYSKWILEHPDYFLQLDHSPYPSYSFTGENLSLDPRVGIYIEDGYWDRRDAAVVFKYVDHGTGQVRYIYHGNDGTSTPWNDTAQLNYTYIKKSYVGRQNSPIIYSQTGDPKYSCATNTDLDMLDSFCGVNIIVPVKDYKLECIKDP